ncbi:MAG TPA: cobalamin-independent methionine synthase II family protein [Baekduia sp.]|nr:cobalamin-independent methionine synthase II family protein [Baekduia sp.]
MSRTPRSIARAEAVGSLIRPAQITDKINAIYSDHGSGARGLVMPEKASEIAQLTQLADAVIPRFVERQIEAGLDVVTDGEMRRTTFMSSFYDSLADVEDGGRFETVDAHGEEYAGLGDPTLSPPLRKVASPLAEEVAYMRAASPYPFKVTIPSPSYFFSDIVNLPTGDAPGSYATRQDFVADALEMTISLVADAVAAGAKWIQFDFPIYPALVDPKQTAWFESIGETPESMLAKAIVTDNAVADSLPDDVIVAMHLCRGNLEGGFWNGALDPIAEQMFTELNYDRFLFEWEDVDRLGSYEPIKHIPAGKIMSMGIVSTKKPELESKDEIKARLDEASKYLDLERMALTSQCGFASLFGDGLISAEEAQWAKLDLIGEVADEVWGRS